MQKKSLFIIIIFITACSPNRQGGVLNGVWKSLGYGKILVIKDNTYSFYDITRYLVSTGKKFDFRRIGEIYRIKK